MQGMGKRHGWIAMVLLMALAIGAKADDAAVRAAEARALQGAATMAVKAPYSRAVPRLALGYDEAGQPTVGVAVREIKSYEKVTVLVVVRRQEGKFVVTEASVPDAAVIKNDEKRAKVTDAVASAVGKVVKTADGAAQTIDAVSGATRYHKRIFETMDYLAKLVVKELEANPDWPKAAVPATD